MVNLDKFAHILAIVLFLLAAGKLVFTDEVPTTFSATVYCITGAMWATSSYFEKFYRKTE